MESLFLLGKASIVEDALTAALCDLLSDIGEPALVRSLLEEARRVNEAGHLLPARPLELGDWTTFGIDLWPHFKGQGEPDAVLWLYRGRTVVAAVVVVT